AVLVVLRVVLVVLVVLGVVLVVLVVLRVVLVVLVVLEVFWEVFVFWCPRKVSSTLFWCFGTRRVGFGVSEPRGVFLVFVVFWSPWCPWCETCWGSVRIPP